MLEVIKYLCERGLSFRGYNQTVGSSQNGNYLGLIQLIAKFNKFLDEHLKNHANKGKGHINYLSAQICNELRKILANRVFQEIISRIKKAKYFSFSLDSTPDTGHIDQLVIIIRYIEENG